MSSMGGVETKLMDDDLKVLKSISLRRSTISLPVSALIANLNYEGKGASLVIYIVICPVAS